MKQFVAIFLFFACCISYVSAQTFLDKLRKVEDGSGSVTVTQSKTIDELVNGRKAKSPSIKQKKDTTLIKNSAKVIETDSTKGSTRDSIKDSVKDSTTVNNHKIVGRAHKAVGFRVQAFAGNNSRDSRNKARSIGARLKNEFPGHAVYVHFYSPRWICRIGNFRTRAEAEAMLRRVKDLGYTRACLVKGKITVR